MGRLSPASSFICGFHLELLSVTFTWRAAVIWMDNKVWKWVEVFISTWKKEEASAPLRAFKFKKAFLVVVDEFWTNYTRLKKNGFHSYAKILCDVKSTQTKNATEVNVLCAYQFRNPNMVKSRFYSSKSIYKSDGNSEKMLIVEVRWIITHKWITLTVHILCVNATYLRVKTSVWRGDGWVEHSRAAAV